MCVSVCMCTCVCTVECLLYRGQAHIFRQDSEVYLHFLLVTEAFRTVGSAEHPWTIMLRLVVSFQRVRETSGFSHIWVQTLGFS